MSLVACMLAVGAGVYSFMEGFAVAAVNAIQSSFISESLKETLSSTAFKMGFYLNTVAIPESEIVNASWLLVGAAAVGILGGILCFFAKKFSAFLVFVSAVMCASAGFMGNGKYGTAFISAIAFLISAVFIYMTSKQNSEQSKSPVDSSVKVPSSTYKVNLKKGEKVNLTKNYPISKIIVGLGWSVNKTGKADFDLDASVFMLAQNNKVTRDLDFVFYSNKMHPSGAVEHMGDNLTGSTGKEDDEQIKIDLNLVPENIKTLVFTVTIYEAEERGHNFGEVSNAFIRIYDEKNFRELLRYDLVDKFAHETGIICGELCKNGSEWSFNAIGKGVDGGLKALCKKYGVSV